MAKMDCEYHGTCAMIMVELTHERFIRDISHQSITRHVSNLAPLVFNHALLVPSGR